MSPSSISSNFHNRSGCFRARKLNSAVFISCCSHDLKYKRGALLHGTAKIVWALPDHPYLNYGLLFWGVTYKQQLM